MAALPSAASAYVFLSYASADGVRASRIAECLETAGIRVWFDRAAIAGGAAWSGEIVRAVQGCAAMVILCSPASMASTNVQRELQLAMEEGRPLLPLLLEPAQQPPEVRYILAGRQSIALLDRPEAQWLPQVLQALDHLGVSSAVGETGPRPAQPAVQAHSQPPAPDRAGWGPVIGRRSLLGSGAVALVVAGLIAAGIKARSHSSGGKPRVAGEAGAPPAQMTLSIFAGTGQAGYANGPALQALFSAPTGMFLRGRGGPILVADSGNNRIRQINPGGVVVDIAGSGVAGYADGPAATAQFSDPIQVAGVRDGTLYVGDVANNRVRAISSAGVVSTLAGSGATGFADGVGTAAQFGVIGTKMAIDSAGTIYMADPPNARIRKITAAGVVTTFAGSGTPGYADGPGSVAQFKAPTGAIMDAAGNLYVLDLGNARIRKIGPSGIVSTVAGTGVPGFADGPGAQAQISSDMSGITSDASGNIDFLDHGNHRIRRIAPDGAVSTIFSLSPDQTPFDMQAGSDGSLFLSDSRHNVIYKLTPNGGG